MAKPTNIDDVKRPGRAAPLPSSRPIVVTNRPMLANDPMMVPAATDANGDDSAMAVPHMSRVISPLDKTLVAEQPNQGVDEMVAPATANTPQTAPDDAEASHETSGTNLAASVAPLEPSPTPAFAEMKPEVPQPVGGDSNLRSQLEPKLDRDPEAALSAEEIAAAEMQTKRELELEQMITSGKYHVPINALERRRSRMHVLLLCIVGALLAVVLADVLFDAGFITAPSHIPHTHFFSTTTSSS